MAGVSHVPKFEEMRNPGHLSLPFLAFFLLYCSGMQVKRASRPKP
jgi:hypothetical protein